MKDYLNPDRGSWYEEVFLWTIFFCLVLPIIFIGFLLERIGVFSADVDERFLKSPAGSQRRGSS